MQNTLVRAAQIVAALPLFAFLAWPAAPFASETGASGPPPLYDNLGDHHHPITTSTPQAQRYFDQGLRLVYAFNHPEAIRSFEEALRLDPGCAMCYWGIALAYGPNINLPMDRESGLQAHAGLQEALRLSRGASEREQAYIRALAKRYAADPPEQRAELDAAYAAAMGEVARTYPDDLDAATLYAEALMDQSPWDYWTAQGEPYPRTRALLSTLERVLDRNANHPGACHYYIHAVEAVQPERAIPCAERLAQLMPGAGHIVHMPAHIYVRVGRYADAVERNIHAVHADEQYIADRRPQDFYPVAYYPHNYHFLAFAATLAGRSQQAIDAARQTAAKTSREVAAESHELQGMVSYAQLVLVRFGRWNEVLAEPLPPSHLPMSMVLSHYARGIAFAEQGKWREAQAAQQALRQSRADIREGWASIVAEIADHALTGELALRRGQPQEAVTAFTQAMRLEDSLPYMEPPYWYYPIRYSLGLALLLAGDAREAEARYREDLRRFPENGWALWGLAESLHAQGKAVEANKVEERFRKAWAGADVPPDAARLHKAESPTS